MAGKVDLRLMNSILSCKLEVVPISKDRKESLPTHWNEGSRLEGKVIDRQLHTMSQLDRERKKLDTHQSPWR